MAEYIEREAAKNAVFNHWLNSSRTLDAVNSIPAADVAPVVHGEWKPNEIWICSSDGEPVAPVGVEYVCSRCGRSEDKMEPYCHCGAKMDKEED